MPARLGKQAVVVGAGMAGLTAAAALADSFDSVIVLEWDALPGSANYRPGTPQCKHAHALLAGGLQALACLFPGFEQDLAAAGAVPLSMGYDYRLERPGYDPFPQRDLGATVYSLTRPLLEFTVRKRVQHRKNISFRECCRAREFVASRDGACVTAIRCEHSAGTGETLQGEFFVDASGHGGLTLGFLQATRRPLPRETSIGIDMGYASAIFDVPDDASPDWKGVVTHPDYPRNRRGGFIFPIEESGWIVSLGGRYDQKPPADKAGFLEHARSLRTPSVYNAIRNATPRTEISRFGFKESRWRHFEELADFPRGLLPFGDTICRFNPIYGQGMSVAALKAILLRRLLVESGNNGDALTNINAKFFAEAQPLLQTPWDAAALPDFLDPQTEGQRPANLAETLKFSAALTQLAAEDPAIHKLVLDVQSLLKPQSAYRDPELVERVKAVMARA